MPQNRYLIEFNNFVISDTQLLNVPSLVFDYDEDRRIRLKNHIQANDYFGTLATIVDIIRQENKQFSQRQQIRLKNIREDLEFLQDGYRIVKKN